MRKSNEAIDEYCEIVLHHIEMGDRIPDGEADVYQDFPYLLPSQIVEIYGDPPRDGRCCSAG